MQNRKGFTLIELLVVIAIIGILASIVLVSFPGATKKAKDSRVISALAQARTVMTYVYANEGSYATFDCTLTDMVNLCAEVAGNNPTSANPSVEQSASAACVYSPLNAKTDYWYCADSTGVAGSTTYDPSATGACDGTTFVCPTITG